MTIEINYTDPLADTIKVTDGTIENQTTPLTFLGKNYSAGYAKIIAENFLHLLENFAYNSPPTNPTEGQLWFNTNQLANDVDPNNSTESYGLKVFNGTNWLPIGIIKKSAQPPTVSNVGTSLKQGDLYVDTSKQQLYIFNGTGWSLIGPQFNAAEKTGAEVELLVDATNNTVRPVLSLFVKTRRVAIISDQEFTPKSIIDGFAIIKQGINLTTAALNANTLGTKFWGTSEKSESLIVGDEIVASKNFIRSDQTSTTNFGINVRNNNGLSIGNDLSFSIGTEGASSFLYNKVPGSTIDLRLRKSNAIRTILRISSNNDADIQKGSIGINVLAPQESLDVSGNIKTDGRVIITSTNALSISTQGGVNVVGNAIIGGNITVGGLLATSDIEPKTSLVYDLGSPSRKWNAIYADKIGSQTSPVNFAGTFYATSPLGFEGDLNGRAKGLLEPITITLSGDINSDAIYLQQGGSNLTLTTTVKADFISSRQETLSFVSNDVLLIERSNQLYRLKKTSLVNSLPVVPIGTILLFSGSASNIPSGYLLCNGEEQLQSQYSALFNLIGYTYKPLSELDGPQSGVSTFALPDLTNEVPIPGTNYIIYTGKIV